ncbi:unnamed protein product [Linum tenue]|uniref:Uncharacterized protein n=1 Tax=Linum tenue TaxID=586396 RepID=A0AAV0NRG7_9ROSI|nr:unnamed protein product [Linum tenue]
MDLKGITWVGDVYEKFETMCLEVEETMYEDTVNYVENQVQTVGASMKKFYAEVMQDLLPPGSEDPAKGTTSGRSEELYTDLGIYLKPKVTMKNNFIKFHDKGQLSEPLIKQTFARWNKEAQERAAAKAEAPPAAAAVVVVEAAEVVTARQWEALLSSTGDGGSVRRPAQGEERRPSRRDEGASRRTDRWSAEKETTMAGGVSSKMKRKEEVGGGWGSLLAYPSSLDLGQGAQQEQLGQANGPAPSPAANVLLGPKGVAGLLEKEDRTVKNGLKSFGPFVKGSCCGLGHKLASEVMVVGPKLGRSSRPESICQDDMSGFASPVTKSFSRKHSTISHEASFDQLATLASSGSGHISGHDPVEKSNTEVVEPKAAVPVLSAGYMFSDRANALESGNCERLDARLPSSDNPLAESNGTYVSEGESSTNTTALSRKFAYTEDYTSNSGTCVDPVSSGQEDEGNISM